MKILVNDDEGRLVGLATATDVPVTLCKSLLSTFALYRCLEESDPMVEWRNRGMVMAASPPLLEKTGRQAEDRVAVLPMYNASCSTCPSAIRRKSNGATARHPTFEVRRDIEHAAMWWRAI